MGGEDIVVFVIGGRLRVFRRFALPLEGGVCGLECEGVRDLNMFRTRVLALMEENCTMSRALRYRRVSRKHQ